MGSTFVFKITFFHHIGSVPEILLLEAAAQGYIILSPTDVFWVLRNPVILVQFPHPRVPGCSWSPCSPLAST